VGSVRPSRRTGQGDRNRDMIVRFVREFGHREGASAEPAGDRRWDWARRVHDQLSPGGSSASRCLAP